MGTAVLLKKRTAVYEVSPGPCMWFNSTDSSFAPYVLSQWDGQFSCCPKAFEVGQRGLLCYPPERWTQNSPSMTLLSNYALSKYPAKLFRDLATSSNNTMNEIIPWNEIPIAINHHPKCPPPQFCILQLLLSPILYFAQFQTRAPPLCSLGKLEVG